MTADVRHLSGLDDKQRAAATYDGRHLRILAGPGSGKTRALVARICHIVASGWANPHEVMAITFTRKAAEELRKRVEHSVVGRDAHEMTIGTVHSVALEIVRSDPGAVNYGPGCEVYDEIDERDLVDEVLRDFTGFKRKQVIEGLRMRFGSGQRPPGRLGEVVDLVIAELRARRAMTFDQLLWAAGMVLRGGAEPSAWAATTTPALRAWRPRAAWLFYDEVQDWSLADVRLVALLKPEHLTVVGDPWQNIYAFRGTDPKFLEWLPCDWPGMRSVTLGSNYRSTSRIINLANRFVEASPQDGVVMAGVDGHTEKGEPVRVVSAADEDDEAEDIALTIKAAMRMPGNPSARPGDFAILTRTHRQHEPIAAALLAHEIPHYVVSPNLFKDRTTRAMIDLLRLLVGFDPLAWVRLLVWLPHATEERQQKLAEALDRARGKLNHFPMPPDEALGFAARTMGIDIDLEELGMRGRLGMIDRLGAWIHAWWLAQPGDLGPSESIARLLEAIALRSYQDDLRACGNKVAVLTIHAAKGLEWRWVFVAGCEDGLLPHGRDTDEEERRLFYVAVTRARERLWLTSAHQRRKFGGGMAFAEPSIYLTECGALPGSQAADAPQREGSA